ncbi:MAG: acyl-ACP--UDP-N-acetylglucosamine O-acyltransferase [Phycisphaerales bacterium]|jgi:UDP-N-acetylglucosamine acyltransferase|nr:acyl-ACP--UDP-N-acetylglucosamine O-acyltransferase [Phycisphaerales bacterium]MDP6310851.1 acyl-ACP--UDP-N-acetylglucosamine O-acyltransferase [Phycisphaerales bacterium]MDP7189567.1 acyl-ACP--UDP-N-acetylglucosamine O-acyltransferase [Phycisphaerales bacterium]MDP7520234.1 acyl-ACP--UDP-N-acetylglucosamine O-acyltransferase [Phycisphaerales bacterium]|tara:strand:+ start:63 stop:926 length:864 start_codon:yes stop_codon:yes gene_type:complete
MSRVHPTAIVDPSAELADDVQIGAYSVVGPHVSIGNGTVLMNHVTVSQRTRIGERNRLHPGCVVGGDPQDRKYEGEPTACRIGDDNEIREHTTIHRGTGNGVGETIIGSGNLLMVGSHVAHDCHIGDRTVIANQVMLAGHVAVEDGASIGGGVGIHHFATIGRFSFVGGLARISRDVPPFMIVEGHPAEVRAVNVIGMLRNGFEQADVDAMKEVHRCLFRHGGAAAAELPMLRDRFASLDAVQHLCAAVEASAAGMHGRARESSRSDDKWVASRKGSGTDPGPHALT